MKIIHWALAMAALFSVPEPAQAISRLSIAIMPIEAAADVSAGDRQAAENSLSENIARSGKFTIIERTRLEQIMKEQGLSLSGATQRSVEIGRLLHADKMLVPKIFKKNNRNAVSASVIDVSKGKIDLSGENNDESRTAADLARYIAEHISQHYPLMGEVLGVSANEYVVDLGSENGIEAGSRLFVARRTVDRGPGGEVLFEELTRIGTLEATRVSSDRSKAKVRALENRSAAVAKGDLVSPEPLPKRPLRTSQIPLLGSVGQGKLLLDDDMSTQQYLSAMNSSRDTYGSGKLHIDATKTDQGHGYAMYPPPFDRLSNIILEGEFKFVRSEQRYNKVMVLFRAGRSYVHLDSYNLFFNSDGGYEINVWRNGSIVENIVPLTSTQYLHRGNGAVNTFRVVAFGPSFDIYVNGKFLVGFEHESYEAGSVWLVVNQTGYATFDDVKIWEAVKK